MFSVEIFPWGKWGWLWLWVGHYIFWESQNKIYGMQCSCFFDSHPSFDHNVVGTPMCRALYNLKWSSWEFVKFSCILCHLIIMKTLQYEGSATQMKTHTGPRDRNHHQIVKGRVLNSVFASTSGSWCAVSDVLRAYECVQPFDASLNVLTTSAFVFVCVYVGRVFSLLLLSDCGHCVFYQLSVVSPTPTFLLLICCF